MRVDALQHARGRLAERRARACADVVTVTVTAEATCEWPRKKRRARLRDLAARRARGTDRGLSPDEPRERGRLLRTSRVGQTECTRLRTY